MKTKPITIEFIGRPGRRGRKPKNKVRTFSTMSDAAAFLRMTQSGVTRMVQRGTVTLSGWAHRVLGPIAMDENPF